MAENPSFPDPTSEDVVHYIVVVHGIGNQRKNETVLPVIRQFAAARHNEHNQASLLTLGSLTAQSRNNIWIELDSIPSLPDASLYDTLWIPRAAAPAQGKNLRFVDFCWSKVTREQHAQVGQPTKDWTKALLNRLVLRSKLGGRGIDWIIFLMQHIREGVLFVEGFIDLRLPRLSNTVFNDFLGDVELYGDFPNTRGRAVRLFHETMAQLHQAHLEEFGSSRPPQYTIIAHSLGTVLTLDAITYAYADIESRSSRQASGSDQVVVYPGYDGSVFASESCVPDYMQTIDQETPPSVDWAKYLQSYVTLGSPIDKYLVLWAENYRHFDSTKWMDSDLLQARPAKIRHFNYCDEQDPVGHELNVLRTTPVWAELMETGEDVVFARYAVPGVAHVEYWNDYDLFHRILDLSIDRRAQTIQEGQKPQGHYAEWFNRSAFRQALIFSYVLVPIIGWFAATLSLDAVLYGLSHMEQAAEFPWFVALVFAGSLVLTHILMKIIIMWRLLLVTTRSADSPMEEKQERQTAHARFRMIIDRSPWLWGVLLMISFIPVVGGLVGFLLTTVQCGLALALAVSLDIWNIYHYVHRRWDTLKTSMDKNFNDYLKPLKK